MTLTNAERAAPVREHGCEQAPSTVVNQDPLLVPIQRFEVRQFTVPAPGSEVYPRAIRGGVVTGPVHGWLVGVSDGRRWGWWGPVAERTAGQARELFDAVHGQNVGSGAATPEGWARQLRRGTRHAHAGALAAAVGAVELACWDLAGQRNDCPVWALTSSAPALEEVRCYATCFGIDIAAPSAATIATEVATSWPVQKWRPKSGAEGGRAARLVAQSAGGGARLALDFGGSWQRAEVNDLCEGIEVPLAWIEEPCAPDEMHLARPGEFPAPHAAGEHCYGPADTAILTAAGVDIWQPDAVFCGGYGNLLTIATLAARAAAVCVPHGGGLIPSLHAAAAAPLAMVEYHLLLEPRRQAHLADPLLCLEGPAMPLPTLPGWAGVLRREIRSGW
jgi:L-alanine-DL-glutamate epimerase-like enolase superfamily enzyme